jgi:multiple sugar transport system substrate-binding protein
VDNKKLLYILAAGIGVVVLITVVLILRSIGGAGGVQNATLEFWGVFDDSSAYQGVIKDFQTANPGVKVFYKMIPYDEYETTLVNALAAGTGPDIFMIHHTWLAKHKDKMSPTPVKFSDKSTISMTAKSFSDQFVDVASFDLIDSGQIFALPLYVDSLALYYNKDLFNSAGITRPPQNWDEFNSDVELLTRFDSLGNVIQSGVAMGTARNINRSTDILMALMVQTGTKMNSDDKNEATFSQLVNGDAVGQRSLQYYTDFANPGVKTYCWNDSQHYSVDAFSEGKSAMMINYSHQAQAIRGKNPRLNFSIAPLPQVSDDDIKNYANYWAVGVANKSVSKEQAWKFIMALTSKDGANKYLTVTNRPAARRDIIEAQKSDDNLGIFAVQSLTAKSWFQMDNKAVELIFADMIDDVNLKRKSLEDAIDNAESRVNVLIQKRNIPSI